jgi:LDH2 family malate/lactate/ureidoglycolate dehydrogenase
MPHAPGELESWAGRVFEACGMPQPDAALTASLLVRSDLRGYRTHGLTRVASYVERLKSGDHNARPRLRHEELPGGVVLDADGAMGHVVGPHAIRLGLAALERSASVLVAVRECGHLGALGIHALLAAEAGVLCLLGQRTPPLLALEGFQRPAIGHNPIAFGCPVPGAEPLVFDIACSVAARGHILLAAREAKSIPAGWALDEEGVPTSDAKRALKGALLPMGGHKGIGIAMMVECLAGAMAATAAALDPARNALPESGAVGRQGAFFWMVKPSAFAGEALFASYMTSWTRHYLEASPGKGRLPGSRGAALEREGRAQGLALPEAIIKELVGVGERLGIRFPA